jgi:hypothetical protein
LGGSFEIMGSGLGGGVEVRENQIEVQIFLQKQPLGAVRT